WDTLRQAFDLRKHIERLVRCQRLDIGDLTAAKPRELELAHDGRYNVIDDSRFCGGLVIHDALPPCVEAGLQFAYLKIAAIRGLPDCSCVLRSSDDSVAGAVTRKTLY